MQPPVNPGVRHAVWDNMWGACWQSRYYYSLYERYARLQKGIAGATLLLGTSAVGSLIESVPNVLLPVVGILLAASTVWSAVGRHAEKAAVAHAVHVECDALHHQFRNLMASIDSYELDTAEARAQADALAEKMRTATDRCSGVGLIRVRDLQVEAEDQADLELKARYDHTTAPAAT